MNVRMLWCAGVLVVLAVAGCSKSGGGAQAARNKFKADFVELHETGVRQGFFGCLYGDPVLPRESATFLDRIKTRFKTPDPSKFITEKAEGCKAKFEETIGKVRMLVAPSPEIGAARDNYVDAAGRLVEAWNPVLERMKQYRDTDDQLSLFNSTYADILKRAGDDGWAVVQKCKAGEPMPDCLSRIGASESALPAAYKYLNFVTCILKAYEVDLKSLLIPDSTAQAENRYYLLGVKALRDKLTDLCSGEPGSSTHIIEWASRVSSRCYAVLDEQNPAPPELFEDMKTWWSSDGVRDRTGEVYSSVAVITDVCTKKEVDLDQPLLEFLRVYGEFAKAVNELSDLLAAPKG
jgi:hypothetical protein